MDLIAELELLGFANFDPYSDPDIVELQAGYEESDGFRHYYISPEKWKASISGEDAQDGEYLYWYEASWAGQANGPWRSIRDWVASCVEEVEGMVERGEKVHKTYVDEDE